MSKSVNIGGVYIGGGKNIAIQSMSTLKIKEIDKAVAQAQRLKSLGCDILRFSVLDLEDAYSFNKVKEQVKMPLVADIHFDYKLAIASIQGGADKIRINPGNIGDENKVKQVASALKEYGVPVRVGSNTGSIEKRFLDKYGKDERALGESALYNASILEKQGVENIVISVKASSVPLMVKAYEYVSKRCDYPLHLGVTEAGGEYGGVIKNAIGIGLLLLNGIGDTIRVSLSADPEREIIAGKKILSSLGLRKDCVDVVACPTCGRCEWDCMAFAKKIEEYVQNVNKALKIAVMGCVVNGPGEAIDADLGVAGGKDGCVIFSHGKVLKKVNKEDLEREFFSEIDKCIKQ